MSPRPRRRSPKGEGWGGAEISNLNSPAEAIRVQPLGDWALFPFTSWRPSEDEVLRGAPQ